jgi:hypothetical protein
MKTGFELIQSSMQMLQQSQQAESRRINQNLTDFFALRNNIFNNASGSQSTTLQPSSSSLPPSQPTPSETVPLYKLDRNLCSVEDVWREYAIGFSGNLSVQSLEQQHGTKWRKDRAESRFYNRRKEFYDYIKDKAQEDQTSCEEIARRLEVIRKESGLTLTKLREKLKEM